MGALELRSATHERESARPKLCHVRVESDRHCIMIAFDYFYDFRSTRPKISAIGFSFALELEISCLILSWGLVLDIERAE